MGILLEGFALLSLAGKSLTVMVTMSGCIWVAMGLLYIFLNYLLVIVYLPEPWSWVIHLVMGLFLWYWHQRVGYGMAIMPRCMLRVCISTGIVINWFSP
jgi:hypothetical protein